MKKTVLLAVEQAIRAIEMLKEPQNLQFIEEAAEMIAVAFGKDKKLLIAGNGGSLCDAIHFAEEFTGQFRHKRKALPAIALSDSGHITCVGNDMGYDTIFSRSVEAFGQADDIFIALTTSGNSPNILSAVETAKEKGLKTIAFLGKTGGKLKGECDLELYIPGFPYSDRVQEVHMAAIHIIIERVEEKLFVEKRLPLWAAAH
jgi:D-sedoheptulose 7-phosphate isomerase